MKELFKRMIRRFFRVFGLDLASYSGKTVFPGDFSESDVRIITEVRPYTMTSKERLFSLIRAVEYVMAHRIEGSIVECGVWRGGSMLTAIRTLQNLRSDQKDVYLFDTFEGMPKPTAEDVSYAGADARVTFEEKKITPNSSDWCMASLDDVQQVVLSSGYDKNKIHFVKGRVEDTIPKYAPEKIALLRLDTDWYESTKHELIHLFPRLTPGGILIIDDYGYWEGARKAIDEYFLQNKTRIFLSRIDHTGRIAVKL